MNVLDHLPRLGQDLLGQFLGRHQAFVDHLCSLFENPTRVHNKEGVLTWSSSGSEHILRVRLIDQPIKEASFGVCTNGCVNAFHTALTDRAPQTAFKRTRTQNSGSSEESVQEAAGGFVELRIRKREA